MSGHVWSCRVMYYSVCIWLVIYGSVWLCMVMQDYVWSCIVVYDHCHISSNMSMAIYGQIWSCIVMIGHFWSCLTIYCHVWLCLVIYGLIWPCLAMYEKYLAKLQLVMVEKLIPRNGLPIMKHDTDTCANISWPIQAFSNVNMSSRQSAASNTL